MLPYLSELVALLGRWLEHPAAAVVSPLGHSGGFSGARLWHVAHADAEYALRVWPSAAGSVSRIERLGQFQRHLAAARLPVPQPVSLCDGGSVLVRGEQQGASLWTLATWRAGVADYWQDPRPTKLRAACEMLARVHLAAASFSAADGELLPGTDVSPAMIKRIARLESLPDELGELRRRSFTRVPADHRSLATEVAERLERALPRVRQQLAPWSAQTLPLHWRLGDVWHDHVLFTGDAVTGLIDFGAAGIDSPAGDVARLLGSMVGDDPRFWAEGLAAYEAIRPLGPAERRAVEVFDSSGTAAAAANWLAWLWPPAGVAAPPLAHRAAAIDRLHKLAARLQVLAA